MIDIVLPQRLGPAAAQRACGGISTTASVPTGECLALCHWSPLTSIAATARTHA